jgi:predicted membrane chloride channel (bestrophin family)
MPYQELEQFLDKGQERAWWLLSWWNAAGLVVGIIAGQKLAEVWGWSSLVCMLVGAAIGLTLTVRYHGIVVARRLWLWLAFWVRSLLGQTTTSVGHTVSTQTERPHIHIRHVRDGRTVIGRSE